MLAGNQRASLLLLIEQSATRADTTLRRERAATSLQACERGRVARARVASPVSQRQVRMSVSPGTFAAAPATPSATSAAAPATSVAPAAAAWTAAAPTAAAVPATTVCTTVADRAKLAHLEVVTKLATLEWWCFGTPYTAFRESKTQRVSTVATPRTAGGNRSRVAAPDATGDDDEMPRFLHDAEAQLRQFQV